MSVPDWFWPIVAGAIVTYLLGSLRRMGARIGALEKFRDREEGRRLGAAEERKKHRGANER